MKKFTQTTLLMLFVSIFSFSTFAAGASKGDLVKGIHKLEKALGYAETSNKVLNKNFDMGSLVQYKSSLENEFKHQQDSIKQAEKYQASLRGQNTTLDSTTPQTKVRLNSPTPTRVSYNNDSAFILAMLAEKKDTASTPFKKMLKFAHIPLPNAKQYQHLDKLTSGWEILTQKKDSLGKLTFAWEPLPAGKLMGVWTNGMNYFSDAYALLRKGKGLVSEDNTLVNSLKSKIAKLEQTDQIHTADIADARFHAEYVAGKSTDYSRHYTDSVTSPIIKQTNNNTADIDTLYRMVSADHKAISSLSKQTHWGWGVAALIVTLVTAIVFVVIRKNKNDLQDALDEREQQIRFDLGPKQQD